MQNSMPETLRFKTDIAFRKLTLVKLLHVITMHEKDIVTALYNDFKKPAFEAVITETAYVIADLKSTIRNLKSWTSRKRVRPSLFNFPSSDFIYHEPYGKVLIIAPWNYPFHLAITPLIAAVAAGNQVVLKPSELAPNTASIIELIICEAFDPMHVEVYQGGAEVSEKLLLRRWDYIFFTGSVAVGKIVAMAAAANLTPVTLELGGKNPCIVDETANLKLAAKRIVWGKFINAGQTCIAPDYIMVKHNVKQKLIGLLQKEITIAYGDDPFISPDFPRIINVKNHRRLAGMIDKAKVAAGGIVNESDLYIAPTLIDEPAPESALMGEEIFGPILPVIGYNSDEELNVRISRYEKPLAFFVFTENSDFAEKLIRDFSFGGGCINDTIVHSLNKRLPFGGVGHSGIGAYHGQFGFDTFSHKKSIVRKGTWLDIPIRYAPYGNKLEHIKKILKWF